ncbi:MAG: hypothetical protein QF570_01575 [Myxococcota bacterium]|jgi:hypothetical protein|nr:hypothetical protein [Myxococcota bacterium]
MAKKTRLTIRLEDEVRAKVEGFADRRGLSMSGAVNQLLKDAFDSRSVSSDSRPYRIKPRTVSFGFDIARARELASADADERRVARLRS